MSFIVTNRSSKIHLFHHHHERLDFQQGLENVCSKNFNQLLKSAVVWTGCKVLQKADLEHWGHSTLPSHIKSDFEEFIGELNDFRVVQSTVLGQVIVLETPPEEVIYVNWPEMGNTKPKIWTIKQQAFRDSIEHNKLDLNQQPEEFRPNGEV